MRITFVDNSIIFLGIPQNSYIVYDHVRKMRSNVICDIFIP
ncbi:hypothetical protein FHX64_002212 [Microbacter margulisiae]|uniref:Uncharacterized protein n=1 Tax=Microbacter margulisiae TaxID=1350067 RepID=A0A7W5H2X5_9PORP|nr:hypothetical protein [Microbacter margulisiae]